MIDTVKIEVDIEFPLINYSNNREQLYFLNLEFTPLINNQGITYGFGSDLNNLHLRLIGGKLIIENSWHKFLKGNNYSDYLFSEIRETSELISDTLGISIQNARVKKLDYGVNISVESPNSIFKSFITHRTSQFYPQFIRPGKEYEHKCFKSDYNIKAYNKTAQLQALGEVDKEFKNLFRFEKQVKYMRHLLNKVDSINIITVADLVNPDNLMLLQKDLINTFNYVNKRHSNLSILTTKEILIHSTMTNIDARNLLLKERNGSYVDYYRKNKQIVKKLLLDSNSFLAEVEKSIEAKLESLRC